MSRLGLLCILCVLGRGVALAQPAAVGGAVSLVQDDCAEQRYDRAAFAELLQIELQALGVEVSEVAEPAGELALVRVSCSAETDQLTLELMDLATRKQVARELSVSDVERSARPRALALSTALLIQSSWAELALASPAPAEAPGLPETVRERLIARLRPPATLATPVVESPQLTAVGLSAALRAFPARNTALLGAELSLVRSFAPLQIALNLEALYGSQELSDLSGVIADADLYWLTAGAELLWASATKPALALGPFVRLGYARATATSRRGGVEAVNDGSFVSALGLSVHASAEINALATLWLGLELGYVLNGTVFLADLARPAGMSDVTFALRAGVRLGL